MFLRSFQLLMSLAIGFPLSSLAAEPARAPAPRSSFKLEVTPLVQKTPDGPARRLVLRCVTEGKPAPFSGILRVSRGQDSRQQTVTAAQTAEGELDILVGEPETAVDLEVAFDSDDGAPFSQRLRLEPARRWKIYMTPHTHYDIGFTHPQEVVMDQLSREMDRVLEYCDQTADWPEESRYRWTVEVSGLVKVYADRHSEADVERLMEYVRDGRVEICGFYLNMASEMLGHEEMIRCLYYAQELRRKYDIEIDTVMIDDVPGYGWGLPQLLSQAGMPRAALRANSIRGQFLWSRKGAVPRPFWWQGPDGSRVFVWYTDSYREGNFFRRPGLHERHFLNVIRRNESAGYPFDHIQLRMGGDNLPPDLNTSINARAWNEKYEWPKVMVATNRQFLETLEELHGRQCPTVAGDIPSWWADGPGSAARETGAVRLLHDQLAATEALWTRAWLMNPELDYPRDRINQAYDKVIHFDEHTWGASCSVSAPHSEETARQWAWKSALVSVAENLTDELQSEALHHLCPASIDREPQQITVWNSLAWPRTDVVEVSLTDTPLLQASGVAVTDLRSGDMVRSQRSGTTLTFVARDVPALGSTSFRLAGVETGGESAASPETATIENDRYRIVVRPEEAGWSSWYDKTLGRELLDQQAAYLGNQPIHERSLDGRKAINEKKPTRFSRTTPSAGRIVDRVSGPVFDELVTETSLPGMPSIRQAVRVYKELAVVDINNVIEKQEVLDPEGVYFAFCFDVERPDLRFEIANATMRPGRDQLIYSCQDFYAINHWASVAWQDGGILMVPIEAPLLTVAGLNAYQWADAVDMANGHLFSWVMNNYWHVNFRASQSGPVRFRYRLTSHAGRPDLVATTQFATQQFQPLIPVWTPAASDRLAFDSESPALLEVQGDPVVVSGLKRAEASNDVIIRLLEFRGQHASCRLKLNLPDGRCIRRAYLADPLERERTPLTIEGNTVLVEAAAHAVSTVGIAVADRH